MVCNYLANILPSFVDHNELFENTMCYVGTTTVTLMKTDW
jgi:hypothetical protein